MFLNLQHPFLINAESSCVSFRDDLFQNSFLVRLQYQIQHQFLDEKEHERDIFRLHQLLQNSSPILRSSLPDRFLQPYIQF
ncbi:hypothetical protein D3C87_1373390 [compost metagenome]